ncbi:MAG: hypothetical protein S4CHLAM123_12180 [Chlamydiales bacterium]|nr:hypothetical protein [Chlamydiales bacterium]
MSNDLSIGENFPPSGIDNPTYQLLDRARTAAKIFTAISLALFALSIVFIGLAQASYIHPIACMYTFSGCIGSFLMNVVIHCYQKRVAKKGGVELDLYFAEREPLPERKKKEKSE